MAFRKQGSLFIPTRNILVPRNWTLRDNRGFISPGVIGGIAGARRRTGGAASVAADIWQTFEFATLSKANLEANDNNASATWVVYDSLGYLSTQGGSERATISNIGGVSDSGTLGLQRLYTTTVISSLECKFDADKDNISYGHWFKFSANTSVNRNLIRSQNNSGNDSLEPITLRYSTRYLGWSPSGNSIGAALTAGSWYWVTVQYNRNATSYLRVYDSSGTQIGAEATTTAPNYPVRRMFVFDYNAQTSDSASSSIDDIIIDYTDATFPLGP